MPKAPIRFDAETAIGAALAALQKLDPETSAAIGNALTALASGTAAGTPQTGATLPAECVGVRQLCAATNWSTDRIYDLMNAGEIQGFTTGGRRYITTASVKAYIARRVADPTVIRYPNPLVKPPSQPAPEPPRMDRRRRKRRTEPIAA